MDDLDIENAITTLNLLYFYKCAANQNLTQTMLENVVISHFTISRAQAKHLYTALL